MSDHLPGHCGSVKLVETKNHLSQLTFLMGTLKLLHRATFHLSRSSNNKIQQQQQPDFNPCGGREGRPEPGGHAGLPLCSVLCFPSTVSTLAFLKLQDLVQLLQTLPSPAGVRGGRVSVWGHLADGEPIAPCEDFQSCPPTPTPPPYAHAASSASPSNSTSSPRGPGCCHEDALASGASSSDPTCDLPLSRLVPRRSFLCSQSTYVYSGAPECLLVSSRKLGFWGVLFVSFHFCFEIVFKRRNVFILPS